MSIALMFPGQGSQAVGMGRALAENFPAAWQAFDEIDAALGHAKTDPMGVVARLRGRDLAGRCRRSPRNNPPVSEGSEAWIRGYQPACCRGLATPARDHTPLSRQVGDLHFGPQAVEGQAFDKIRHEPAGQIEQEPVAVGKDNEVEQDLALRREQPAIDGAAVGFRGDVDARRCSAQAAAARLPSCG